jgi:hypothetical protein
MREMTRAELDGQICCEQESMHYSLACGLVGAKLYPTNNKVEMSPANGTPSSDFAFFQLVN